MSCIFCKIINKEIPSSVVYETDTVLAILDLSQANQGHTLVMPKVHFANLLEVTPDVMKDLAEATLKVATAINQALKPDGLNILNNCNEAAGQTVMHMHIHIIPRFKDDLLKIDLPNNQGKYDLEDIKEKIKACL